MMWVDFDTDLSFALASTTSSVCLPHHLTRPRYHRIVVGLSRALSVSKDRGITATRISKLYFKNHPLATPIPEVWPLECLNSKDWWNLRNLNSTVMVQKDHFKRGKPTPEVEMDECMLLMLFCRWMMPFVKEISRIVMSRLVLHHFRFQPIP
ncbi:hypothetical protein NPIL_250121 [Nephila pilipes]|uniref:Uncharacterized protein n=1 Tax=Nephila pilipes TaxID=299642 RepID=A0A8X6TIZ4_NEPPI|nr:hypothetical protein NPIL_250121 [Nephila pilipes]